MIEIERNGDISWEYASQILDLVHTSSQKEGRGNVNKKYEKKRICGQWKPNFPANYFWQPLYKDD